jgi:hypothetical protein
MREIAFHDVCDDHFMPVSEKHGSQITPHKAIATENNMSHNPAPTLNL